MSKTNQMIAPEVPERPKLTEAQMKELQNMKAVAVYLDAYYRMIETHRKDKSTAFSKMPQSEWHMHQFKLLSKELAEFIEAKTPDQVLDALVDICIYAMSTAVGFGFEATSWEAVMTASVYDSIYNKQFEIVDGNEGTYHLIKPEGYQHFDVKELMTLSNCRIYIYHASLNRGQQGMTIFIPTLPDYMRLIVDGKDLFGRECNHISQEQQRILESQQPIAPENNN